MNEKNVFISSVMRGFAAERAAARRAVETLRHQPVMAEDFGATASTPQTACLEGVRRSHIYVGIFGQRYGNRVESGHSPTEEEFREAERRGLDMLCFVMKGALDDDQKQFVDSIKSYEHGKMLAFYESTDELKDLIVQALNDLSLASLGGGLDASVAQKKFESRISSDESSRRSEPECRLAIIPERQVDEYLSPHDLSEASFREKLEQLLLFGPQPRLFDREKGVRCREGEDFLCLWQGRDEYDSPDTSVSIYADGTIILADSLTSQHQRDRFSHGLLRSFVVDEQNVLDRASGFFAFSESVYSSLEAFRQASAFFTWLQLANMRDKSFGRIPSSEPNSFQMPSHSLDDPVSSPPEPQRIVRKQLLDHQSLANDLISRLIRRFKAAGGYYESSERLH
ncbi:DUF4062 domain-containing protein [Aeoliella mucimassa]|uniref:DUF4062 domain-containing protein n=1 Tax=Aeoliella mucimassa TaxID=2527972 RepID=A0A518AS40_9BACT|nr:DUF4062 domain-containing protein [Aeoliella mucimassa]QDU57526.1 hypothetical protein Pan181_37440 [Aeoliella mucimassa]